MLIPLWARDENSRYLFLVSIFWPVLALAYILIQLGIAKDD